MTIRSASSNFPSPPEIDQALPHSSVWSRLSEIDVSKHTETKGGFSYLSWSWAWASLKTSFPDATFEKHLFANLPYMIDPEGFAYVMVTVTVLGQSATEILPVLNHGNKPVKNPDSFMVNTSLQRCLVKAIAFHGLGHYIYAGEDVPPGAADKPRIEDTLDLPAAPLPAVATSHSELAITMAEESMLLVDVQEDHEVLVAARKLTNVNELNEFERAFGAQLDWLQSHDQSLYGEIAKTLEGLLK